MRKQKRKKIKFLLLLVGSILVFIGYTGIITGATVAAIDMDVRDSSYHFYGFYMATYYQSLESSASWYMFYPDTETVILPKIAKPTCELLTSHSPEHIPEKSSGIPPEEPAYSEPIPRSEIRKTVTAQPEYMWVGFIATGFVLIGLGVLKW